MTAAVSAFQLRPIVPLVETERALSDAGYEPVPITTDEFQKASSSVCRLKLELGPTDRTSDLV